MASLTMMASFLGGAATAVADRPSIGQRRSLFVPKAAAKVQEVATSNQEDNKENGSRRAVMLAAAAAAVCAIGQGTAVAGEAPERGTPEAKKLYAPVCVTMPTAKICHK